MKRSCPECGSTSVVMFDADEDWCTQCKSRFPGASSFGGYSPLHYCTADMDSHACRLPVTADTQSTTAWEQVTCARCLQTALTTAREENERLTAENANLRAATRGKTFFHSDEEVNAEMGRLRAEKESLVKELHLTRLALDEAAKNQGECVWRVEDSSESRALYETGCGAFREARLPEYFNYKFCCECGRPAKAK